MRVGSLVELVDNNWPYQIFGHLLTYPVKNKVYNIRLIRENDSILLDEIDNSYLKSDLDREPGFNIKRFRELLPPIEISIENILEKELV